MLRPASLSILSVGLLIAQQAEEPPLFKTSVSLVKVDAKVTTRDGRTVNDLSKDDFIVHDEDSACPIVELERESKVEPVNLLLLLDTSGSMSRLLAEMSAKTSEALRPLKNGDRVGVMVFATDVNIVQPFTGDLKIIPERVVNSVFKTTTGRGTLVNEALVAGSAYLNEQAKSGQRAMLLVTDNEGSRASTSDADALRALHNGDVVLNAIVVGGSKTARGPVGRYSDPASAQPDVFRYVQNTGGDVITDEDPGQALSKIVRQIATRYSFQYSPPQAEPGTFRKIRVELSPAAQRRYPGAVVQARTGYYVEK